MGRGLASHGKFSVDSVLNIFMRLTVFRGASEDRFHLSFFMAVSISSPEGAEEWFRRHIPTVARHVISCSLGRSVTLPYEQRNYYSLPSILFELRDCRRSSFTCAGYRVLWCLL